jgi:hypothetical protein
MTSVTTEEATTWLFEMASRVPFNIAPERISELIKIIGSGEWEFLPSKEPANFFAIPKERRIFLSHAGQASLWCLAFVAFHVIDASSRRQRAVDKMDHGAIDIGDVSFAMRLDDYVDYSMRLFKADSVWPEGLAIPQANPAKGSADFSINEIYFSALGWILLHEIAHVHFGHEKDVPDYERIRNEWEADNFATKWIFSCIDEGLTADFRVRAVSLGAVWLLIGEAKLGPGHLHPRAILRLREATSHFKAGSQSVGLEYAAYILKAIFDPETNPPIHDTPDEAFEWIVTRLGVIFPAH